MRIRAPGRHGERRSDRAVAPARAGGTSPVVEPCLEAGGSRNPAARDRQIPKSPSSASRSARGALRGRGTAEPRRDPRPGDALRESTVCPPGVPRVPPLLTPPRVSPRAPPAGPAPSTRAVRPRAGGAGRPAGTALPPSPPVPPARLRPPYGHGRAASAPGAAGGAARLGTARLGSAQAAPCSGRERDPPGRAPVSAGVGSAHPPHTRVGHSQSPWRGFWGWGIPRWCWRFGGSAVQGAGDTPCLFSRSRSSAVGWGSPEQTRVDQGVTRGPESPG